MSLGGRANAALMIMEIVINMQTRLLLCDSHSHIANLLAFRGVTSADFFRVPIFTGWGYEFRPFGIALDSPLFSLPLRYNVIITEHRMLVTFRMVIFCFWKGRCFSSYTPTPTHTCETNTHTNTNR